MAAARIAAVFLTTTLPMVCAQQSSRTQAPQAQVTIQAIDETGAFIAGARIQVDPAPSPLQSTFIADGQGQAAVDLPAGIFTLSIAAPGFRKRIRQIDVPDPPINQTITAGLDIDPTPLGPAYFGFQPDIDLLRPPDPAPLAYFEIALLGRPFEHLSPLPRKRWWRHLFGS
jgi:hypothetical protein